MAFDLSRSHKHKFTSEFTSNKPIWFSLIILLNARALDFAKCYSFTFIKCMDGIHVIQLLSAQLDVFLVISQYILWFCKRFCSFRLGIFIAYKNKNKPNEANTKHEVKMYFGRVIYSVLFIDSMRFLFVRIFFFILRRLVFVFIFIDTNRS